MTRTPTVTPLRRCIRCGAKAVKPRKGSGRTTNYRTMPCMPIPEDLLIPACGRCQSEYLDEETSAALGPQLQEVYLACLRTRVRIAIDILSRHVSQRRLERMMGMSQGYFSRLRAGAGNPSPELVSHLALLCHDPPKRIEELARFWSLPDEEWPPLPIPETRSHRRMNRKGKTPNDNQRTTESK
jgi:transcriptional regulator with XRE-family HTH domain